MAEVGKYIGPGSKDSDNIAFCRVCEWQGSKRVRYDLAAAEARAHQCAGSVAGKPLVGIDPSFTGNGIIIKHRTGEFVSLTVKSPALSKGSQDPHEWSSRIERTAAAIVAAIPHGSLVAIEGPALYAKFGNPDERAGLRWSVIARLRSNGCRVVVISPSSGKMWLTDKGNAKKPEMIAAARELAPEGLTIHNEHEADAFAFVSMLADQMGQPIFEPRSRASESRAGVAWEHLKESV